MGKEIYHTRLSIPVTKVQKDKLAKVAEESAISMNQLIRNAIEEIIKKHDKKKNN